MMKKKRDRGSLLTREQIRQRVSDRRDEVLRLSLKNETPTKILAKTLRVNPATISADIRFLKSEGRLPANFQPRTIIRRRFILTDETRYLLCEYLRKGLTIKRVASELDVGVQTLRKRLKETSDPKILDALRINKIRRQPQPKTEKPISDAEITKAKVDEWAESQGKTIDQICADNRAWMRENGYFAKTPKGTNTFTITVPSYNRGFTPAPSWLAEWQKK